MKDTIRDWIEPTANIGMIIAVIAFFISDHQRLLAIHTVMTAYEAHGTPALVEFKARVDERMIASDKRVDRLEVALNSLSEIQRSMVKIEENQKRMEENQKRIEDKLVEHMKVDKQ